MKTYTGKTVDDAVSKACLDLGVTIDQLNYEVTQLIRQFALLLD